MSSKDRASSCRAVTSSYRTSMMASRSPSGTTAVPVLVLIVRMCRLVKIPKMPCEFPSSSIDSRLDGTLWKLKTHGNLFVAQLVNIPQCDRLPVCGRQLGERPTDNGNLIVLLE